MTCKTGPQLTGCLYRSHQNNENPSPQLTPDWFCVIIHEKRSQMSNFQAPAINPATGKEEQAEFLDDYYGHHQYAVRFADGGIYPASQVNREHEK